MRNTQGHRGTPGSAAATAEGLKDLLTSLNMSGASQTIHHETHLFTLTSFRTGMSSGQPPGHGQCCGDFLRLAPKDSPYSYTCLLYLLYDVCICISKCTSGWGLPYLLPGQQSPSTAGAAGSQHDAQLQLLLFYSTPKQGKWIFY